MFTDLSLARVLHHLSHLELSKVHEEELGEDVKSVHGCHVRDQTPLLQQQRKSLTASWKHLNPQ